MKKVTVASSKIYDVLIGEDLLKSAGTYIKEAVKGAKAIIVTDDIVESLYAEALQDSLEKSGYEVCRMVFPNGEKSKSAENYIQLLNFLTVNKLCRTDVIIALGGGVTGDLAGFAAATYQRGVAFVQVPTTLVAAVDSSVGGKTAINLEAGKNQAGAFYQPDLVLCDYSTLSTLSKENFQDGCAEIIKYGIIADSQLFNKLKLPITEQLEEIIENCVSIKRDIVETDEYDMGKRQLLNFGHTIGHALEACSDYRISHGSAVAKGMAAITKAAVRMGICDEESGKEIKGMLNFYGFDTKIDYGLDEIYEIMISDKKRDGGSINLIFPEKIGKCTIKKVPVSELKDILALCL